MIKSYIITIADNEISEKASARCNKSHIDVGNEFKTESYNAIVPTEVDRLFKFYNIKWSFPWEKEEQNLAYGLTLKPYSTVDRYKRMACFLSHYSLWNKCIEVGNPFIILEHDALWIKKLNPEFIVNSTYNIVGLNNPIGATRRADIFDSQVQFGKTDILPVPSVDEFNIPQGLAGNSAYLIKPEGASDLIHKVRELGAWPNDAIMCKQLIYKMGVTKKYYTKVQGTISTTSK